MFAETGSSEAHSFVYELQTGRSYFETPRVTSLRPQPRAPALLALWFAHVMHWQRFQSAACTWVVLLLLLIQQAPATILDAPAVAAADQHRQLQGEEPGFKRALLSYPEIAQQLNLTVPQVQDLAIYLSNYAWPLNQDRPLTPDQLSNFLSQNTVKVIKPSEGGVWVSSEDVKIGNDSGLVLSAYFHPTK